MKSEKDSQLLVAVKHLDLKMGICSRMRLRDIDLWIPYYGRHFMFAAKITLKFDILIRIVVIIQIFFTT